MLWQLGSVTGMLDETLYSSPLAIVTAGADLLLNGGLLTHLLTTASELLVGWTVGSVSAISLGVLVGMSGTLRLLLDPLLMAFYVMPRLAIYPLLAVWFGIGMGSKIAMVFLGTFFMVIINTISGVRDIPAVYLQVARSFGLSPLRTTFQVVLPSAGPAIANGLRQGLSQGVIAVITAEMFLSFQGLGFLIIRQGQALRMDGLLFLVLLSGGLAYGLVTLLVVLERAIAPHMVGRGR